MFGQSENGWRAGDGIDAMAAAAAVIMATSPSPQRVE